MAAGIFDAEDTEDAPKRKATPRKKASTPKKKAPPKKASTPKKRASPKRASAPKTAGIFDAEDIEDAPTKRASTPQTADPFDIEDAPERQRKASPKKKVATAKKATAKKATTKKTTAKKASTAKKTAAKCPKCVCKPCKCEPSQTQQQRPQQLQQPQTQTSGGVSSKLSSIWNSKGGDQPKALNSSEPNSGKDVYESLKIGAKVVHQENDPRADSLRQRIGEIADHQTGLDRESLSVGERKNKQESMNQATQALIDDVAEYAQYKKSKQHRESLATDIKRLTTDAPASQPRPQQSGGGKGRGFFGAFKRGGG